MYLDCVIEKVGGIIKVDLVCYYVSVVEWMLLYLYNWLMLLVCVFDGIDGECFFQKYFVVFKLQGIMQLDLLFDLGYLLLLVINLVEVLVGVVQMGMVEFYMWNVLVDCIEQFDCIVFDIDLDLVLFFVWVIEVMQFMFVLFDEFGLKVFLKISGGNGMYVVVLFMCCEVVGWDMFKVFV